MGNAGVPSRRRARLFHLPFCVALRLRMRSNCWVEETMVLPRKKTRLAVFRSDRAARPPTATNEQNRAHGHLCSGARNMKEGRGFVNTLPPGTGAVGCAAIGR